MTIIVSVLLLVIVGFLLILIVGSLSSDDILDSESGEAALVDGDNHGHGYRRYRSR